MYKFKKGFYADIRIEDRFSTTLTIKNSKLDSYKEISEKTAFIRVFDGSMWYYASTADIENIQTELDKLYAFARADDSICENPVVARFQVNKDSCFRFTDRCVKDIDGAKKLEILSAQHALLNSDFSKFKQSMYLDRYSVYEFYSSKGADLKYDFQLAGIRHNMAFARGEENFTNSLSESAAFFDDIKITQAMIADFIAESEDFVQNAKSVTPGSYPVVLAPVVTGVFAHESFGHKSEADFMLGDEALAKEWKLGKKVGADILSICDSGKFLGSGYVPYDDEGTRSTETYLIKEGVLTGRLHSAQTAAALDEGLTGNARAINCDFEPIVRMTSTYVLGGNETLDSLIKGIKHGFYIKTLKHGSGMSTFTIAPNLAYEIVDGKIAQPVKIAVLTGNVFETLGDIDGVADDFELLAFVGGGCGKMEQYPLNVGMGGPHIRISKINVQ